MMRTMEEGSKDNVVKVSVAMVLLGIVVIFGVGLLGGLLAVQIWPPQAPLSNDQAQLITTTQEVIISPSTSTVEMIKSSNRSVFKLVDGISGRTLGSAVVMTNDGAMATTASLPKTKIQGIDYQGNLINLERMGRDAVYGIEWLRVPDAVLTPIDIRSSEGEIGYEFMALARSSAGELIKTQPYILYEYSLPPEISTVGAQRLFKGSILGGMEWSGSPLLDEEGKLAGLILKPESGLALAAGDVADSLARLARGAREQNTLAELGLALKYRFVRLGEDQKLNFAAEVVGVTNNSPAALATIKRGDLILAVNEERVTWQRSVVEDLEQDKPYQVTVQRGDKQVSVLVQEAAPSPAAG